MIHSKLDRKIFPASRDSDHTIRGIYEIFRCLYGILLGVFVNEEERDCE
jgi:hypothetical protein